jgi:TonB-dependent SusC/RagA subfamily outer membrane receptor
MIYAQQAGTPARNPVAATAGRTAGVISYQKSDTVKTEFYINCGCNNKDRIPPLIVIDNIEVTAEEMKHLQPEDIASFSILKDSVATALYGARGAGGIILIKTKKGSMSVDNNPQKLNGNIEPETVRSYQNRLFVRVNSPAALKIYSVNGALIRQINSLSAGTHEFPLPQGFYIVVLNDRREKIVIGQ